MITYKYQINKDDFWEKYFFIYNAMQSKTNKLTKSEIKFIIEILNAKDYPYRGDERKRIMKVMKFSTSGFSVNLNRLMKKGLIGKKEDTYYIHDQLEAIRNYLHQSDNIKMTFDFDLNGADI